MFWRAKTMDVQAIGGQIQAAIAPYPITLESCRVKNGAVVAVLACDAVQAGRLEPVRAGLQVNLACMPGVHSAQVILTAARMAGSGDEAPAGGRKPPQVVEGLATGVKHIIAVASGKGGVGKSTVATNLAVALARQGVKVGLLDADIYGPSIPMMMGEQEATPTTDTKGKLQPILAHGVKCMSMGFLVDTQAPMIWRGPMVQSAILQMLRDVDWSDTDILVVDMPPGTGDAQLTLAQKIKLKGAIIVSTPQDVALIDARKGLEMFRKVGVPILGIVQNMGLYCCPNCGYQSVVFGRDGARDVAKELDVPFLADIPIDVQIRKQGDAGVPITALPEPGDIAQSYLKLARDVQKTLAEATSA